MHQPHTGQNDPYKMQDEFVHPHDPRYQKDLLYVSDSCRAWRDENLLYCYSSTPPMRLLLATHPELWLDGSVKDRNAYIQVLIDNATRSYKTYFNQTVRHVWDTHPGPRLHNKREASKNGK